MIDNDSDGDGDDNGEFPVNPTQPEVSMKREMRALSPIALIPLLAFVGACNDTPTLPANALVEGNPALSRGGSSDAEEIRVQDKCEPDSFNAAIGEGTCVGDENVTFEKFLTKLNPDDFGHGAWRFHPEDTHIDEGESLEAVNEGGEVHSFTEVLAFGGGIVPELNDPLGLTTPAVPAEPLGPTFLGPGGTRTLSDLSEGTHLFMCFIHPWMRLELEVRADD